jgi:type II secretory pathway predicted ATPase ExeA
MGCRILRATAEIEAYVAHYGLQEQPLRVDCNRGLDHRKASTA